MSKQTTPEHSYPVRVKIPRNNSAFRETFYALSVLSAMALHGRLGAFGAMKLGMEILHPEIILL